MPRFDAKPHPGIHTEVLPDLLAFLPHFSTGSSTANCASLDLLSPSLYYAKSQGINAIPI